MAASIKISDLSQLVSGSIVGTTKIPVVDGGTTLYAQASSIKAYVSSDLATDAELASQISAVNSTISGLTTANISENASYKYYTDARVTDRLNVLNVLSGSSTSLIVSDGSTNVTAVDKITFNNATVFNAGSGDVTVTVPSSLTVGNGSGIPISSVDTITFPGATIADNTNGDITVTISGTATNISALNSFTSSANSSINSINSTTGSINLTTGSINSFTGSIRGEVNSIEAYTSSLKAASIVSSSQQITNLGFLSSSFGLISSSQQISDFGFISASGGTTIPQGTVSGSQQIVGLGFVTTSSLATGPNFHIISQSIIATDPIDSNLLLSSVYVDKTRTITFSQFSASLDSRFGAGGGSDYISNVTFGNNRLTFTGVGSAFNDFVQFPNGLVSSSAQLNGFGFLTSTDVNSTYIVNRLPSGVISGSTQITNLGFATTSSLIGNGFISSSAQITLTNSNTGGFDTSYVAENVNYKYYTDARVQNVLNGLTLVSGSFGLPSGSVSSSSQIDYQLIYNKPVFYTGSNNVFITSGSSGYSSPWVIIEVLSPTLTQFSSLVSSISSSLLTNGIVSSSTQISNLGFVSNGSLAGLNNWTGSSGGFGLTSSSLASRIVNLSNVVLTASAQIDYDFIQNTPTFAPGDGILISQSLENAITITNNASAPTWNSITSKPNNLVSSSLQVDGYNLFAKTGSTNTFYGNQTVNGEVQTTDLTVTGISDFQGAATFAGTSTFNNPVINEITAISVNGFTASLDFSIGNLFEINLDGNAITHISASNISFGQTATVLITTANQSTASFSSNVRQPFGSFYTASLVGSIDIITLTKFNSTDVYVTSVKNNFV
jgi:hypothetical protein